MKLSKDRNIFKDDNSLLITNIKYLGSIRRRIFVDFHYLEVFNSKNFFIHLYYESIFFDFKMLSHRN